LLLTWALFRILLRFLEHAVQRLVDGLLAGAADPVETDDSLVVDDLQHLRAFEVPPFGDGAQTAGFSLAADVGEAGSVVPFDHAGAPAAPVATVTSPPRCGNEKPSGEQRR
jgi:hypothetical protein